MACFDASALRDRLERYTVNTINHLTKRCKGVSIFLTQESFIALLSKDFGGRFDFVYVPIDFRTGGTLGYGFVNLTSAVDVLPFYHRLAGFRLPRSRSVKPWLVAYARSHHRLAAVPSLVCSKIDRRGRCVRTDTQAGPADDQRDYQRRSNRALSKLCGWQ